MRNLEGGLRLLSAGIPMISKSAPATARLPVGVIARDRSTQPDLPQGQAGFPQATDSTDFSDLASFRQNLYLIINVSQL